MTISPARIAELSDAFGVLYGPANEHLAGQLAHAFRLVARGELNPDDLLVARQGGQVTGAVLCQALPGAVAVIWPPRAVGDEPAIEDALTAAALEHVAGVKVVQAFLPPGESRRAGALLRAGFRHVGRIWQMRRERQSPTTDRPVSTLSLVPYPQCDGAEFLRVLSRCHDDSLDCPELHGLRTPAEVLDGYRDCAPDQDGWWLARRQGEAVGVLILGASDLVFVGVLPERRGQRIGRALVNAACVFAPVLNVTVDARNFPALQLYRSVGFEPIGEREVFIALRHASAGAPATDRVAD